MPRITLIVCTYGDRELLGRLLESSRDCYDELFIIHDGPDFEDVRSLVEQHGGRFIERPRAFSQEPHIPYAIGEASHDWILRFDTDEYPSSELKQWLIEFRSTSDVDKRIAGYQWICPAWNGRKRISKNWPYKFVRLFNRNRVSVVGVCENGPHPDPNYFCPKMPLRFWHEPKSPSHGLRNIFGKQRTSQARKNLTQALLGSPLDHPTWRHESDEWPAGWQDVKEHPIFTGLWRLFVWPPRQALAMLLSGDLPRPSVFCHAGLFHASVCFELWKLRRNGRRKG
jgi:hypothetical protein